MTTSDPIWAAVCAALEMSADGELQAVRDRYAAVASNENATFGDLYTIDDLRTLVRAATIVTQFGASALSGGDLMALMSAAQVTKSLRALTHSIAVHKGLVPDTITT